MFADPDYQGHNHNGVDFDIDSFIGGTDLESKWKALPHKEITQIRALYDGCTRQFDDCVARILAALERNGLADNTIVIVTSDHGDDHLRTRRHPRPRPHLQRRPAGQPRADDRACSGRSRRRSFRKPCA